MIRSLTFNESSPFFGYRLTGLTSLTIFVGQNNSGKTALLEEIYFTHRNDVAYISVEELQFLLSDNTIGVSKQVQKLRDAALKEVLDLFYAASAEMQQLILKYFTEITDLIIDYHEGTLGHFHQRLEDRTYLLDITEIGGAHLTIFALLVHALAQEKSYILIDGPELGLHADMQKRLAVVIKAMSKQSKRQVFVATHSHLFLDRIRPQNNFKIKNIDWHRQISQLKSSQDIYITIYQLLGNAPDDIFMPSNFIIVEGPSDKIFLVKLMQRFYAEQIGTKNIIVQPALGDVTNKQIPKTLVAIEKLFNIVEENSMYQNRCVVLVDSQDKTIIKDFKRKYKLKAPRFRSLGEINRYALEEAYPHDVLKRIISKRKIKIKNPRDLIKVILRNKKHKKIKWAELVGDEIEFDEVPQIFKDIIETAIKLSL